jgi:hypothetical protein
MKSKMIAAAMAATFAARARAPAMSCDGFDGQHAQGVRHRRA